MAYQFIFLDYETYNFLNLKEVGLDNYAKHPSLGISCLGWACDHEEVEAWLPHAGSPPLKLLSAMKDPNVIKIAWNASFEYQITKNKMGFTIPITEFRDPIVLSRNLSLPGRLEQVGEILKLQYRKDPRGDELKNLFCMPANLGKKKGYTPIGTMTLFGKVEPLFRNHISHPKEFAEYVEYCKQDVRSEREAWYRLVKIPFPETQWKGWFLDQKINERGMPGRRDLAEKALRLATKFVDLQNKALKDLTKLQNPNSDTQFKAWARERGWKLNSLRATSVEAELKNPELKLTDDLRKAFGLRKSVRKSSYKKLVKFLALLSTDDYLKYQFSYLGASRTGRWKSGGKEEATNSMQVQNMSRGEKVVKKKLATALKLIEAEDYDGLVREFTNTKDPKDSVTVVEVVITILRSLFQAKSGYTHVVADKNAIENRLLGWAAGCRAILDVFRTCNSCGHLEENLTGLFKCSKCGGEKARDPYLAFGTKMYNKPYEQMWADKDKNEDRQNSKPAVLGAGYGLGGGELYINSDGDEVRGGLWGYAKNVCGVDMPKELAHKAVKVFRDSYPEVLQFWTDMEEAFKQVLRRGGIIKVGEVTWDKENKEWVEHPTQGKQCVLTFRRHKIEGGGYIISMELPSGRSLHYFNATIDEEQKINKNTGLPYTVEILRYDGIEHSATQDASGKTEKKKHKWGRVKTCGSKLVENAIQAMARDDLLESMLLAAEMGFLLWGLFHDELAAEVLKDAPLGERLTLDDLIWCMVQIASWAPGLILGAEGFVDEVYHK